MKSEGRYSINNLELAVLLRNVAASYKLKGEEKNKFRIIAYERAADAVEHLSTEAKDLWDEGKLEEIAGIGKSIAAHLSELFETGKSKHFEGVMKGISPAVFDLIKIPGIGPKTAYKLVDKLNISEKFPYKNLEKSINKGEISRLEGFGVGSQESFEKSLKEFKNKKKKRMLLPYASQRANQVIAWLKKKEFILKADPLGSLRRKVSTIGDIDIAVSTNEPEKAIDHFLSFPKKTRILEKGERTASIILPGNIQVDLMVQGPNSYGATLQHLTGSKHHNIALREYAQKKGLSLSEYGIRSKIKNKKSKIKSFKNEEQFYNHLGMEGIPPELREGADEIDKSLENNLPKLIESKDIKSDFHVHSSFDIETSHDLGLSSMKSMVKKAGELGYEYFAFTEHNPSKSKHTEKQIVELLKKKQDKIAQLNYSLRNNKRMRVNKVFNSLEVDILPNGNLPLSEKTMELLDFVLVSVHSSFRQPKKIMTQRVLNGLNYPKVKIFAHPTARKLNEREGIEVDWEEIFAFCENKDKWIEINASPSRLDLPSHLVKEAIKGGIKLTLGTDSHHVDHMDNMVWGVSVARRGWAEKKDVINTLSLAKFESVLKSYK